jgi:hypothetical protein
MAAVQGLERSTFDSQIQLIEMGRRSIYLQENSGLSWVNPRQSTSFINRAGRCVQQAQRVFSWADGGIRQRFGVDRMDHPHTSDLFSLKREVLICPATGLIV